MDYNFDEEIKPKTEIKKTKDENHYHQHVGMARIQDGMDFTAGTGNVMMVGLDQFGNKTFYQGTVTSGASIDVVTTVQRLALTPTSGQTVFDTNLLSLFTYYSGTWYSPTAGSSGTDTIEQFLNQTGATITLANAPTFISGVYREGQRLVSTGDYTRVGAVITFVTALSADDVEVVYKY